MTNWADHMKVLREEVADGFGMTVTLARSAHGGAFDASVGTETGGVSRTCTVRANRISRDVIPVQNASGGYTKMEQTVYEVTPEDLATPLSGTWGIGEPRHADRIIETDAVSGGDGKSRAVSSVRRAPSTENYVITTRAPATLGG